MNGVNYMVTFVDNGYVVGVFYNLSDTTEEAIESAKLYFSGEYTSVRAELLEESYGDH